MKRTAFFLALLVCACYTRAQIRCGAEQTEKYLPLLEGKRVSAVVNQTSCIGQTHLLDTLQSLGISLVQAFSPEHGFRGDADAGEAIRDGKDRRTGIPVLSLYGKNKKPTPAQLAGTDIVLFDIQDVGARFYTYISTLFYIMEACAEEGKEVLVLDRPNPCDYVDGPVRASGYKSFVGILPIPLLHGCTVGELACMINGRHWLNGKKECRLTVVPVEGWTHGQAYDLPVKPSPNLPNARAIALYPSLCLLEGTSVSVGRGTKQPFQLAGSPQLEKVYPHFSFIPRSLPGWDKNPIYKDQRCFGLDLTAETPPRGFSLRYIIALYEAYKKAGMEKDFFSRPAWFDLLAGNNLIRTGIQSGKTEAEIRASWEEDLARYKEMRKKYLLYPDSTPCP